MEFLRKLFQGLSGAPKEGPDAILTESQLEAINLLSRPAVHLRHGGQGFSRIGGLPDLPDSLDWPHDGGAPLSFLAQIDLSALPDIARDMGFPARGYLWIFYDQEQSVWGMEPQELMKWRVLFAEQAAEVPAVVPEGLSVRYSPVLIDFDESESLPDYSEVVAESFAFSEPQWDFYHDLRDAKIGPAPLHQIGGWPYPIQNGEMETDCNAGFGMQADDWRLLLQLDSDDDADMMWADSGMLYFWIREADLRAARFDRVWMVLQCC